MLHTFLMSSAEHRHAAAGFRGEAVTTLDRRAAPKLLNKAGEREMVAEMMERRVGGGTHNLPAR